MKIPELELLLSDTKFKDFIGFIYPIERNGYKYKDLFKIGNNNTGQFCIKIRKNNKISIIDTIDILNKINDSENFINNYVEIIRKGDILLLFSEWIDGVQPINDNRNYLPSFFSKLAYLNKKNIVKDSFTSMYVDGNHFDSIYELIDYEINYHKNYYKGIIDENIIKNSLSPLKKGFACVILEDMNTGNLIISNKQELKFIDVEWIINGINLYQFEKMDYFEFEEEKWYKMNKETQKCYEAYFETFGIKNDEANEQIKAFELLQVLRKNTFLKFYKKDNDEEIKRRIKIVLEHNKFI